MSRGHKTGFSGALWQRTQLGKTFLTCFPDCHEFVHPLLPLCCATTGKSREQLSIEKEILCARAFKF